MPQVTISIASRSISRHIMASVTPTRPNGRQRKSGNSSSVNSAALRHVVAVTEANWYATRSRGRSGIATSNLLVRPASSQTGLRAGRKPPSRNARRHKAPVPSDNSARSVSRRCRFAEPDGHGRIAQPDHGQQRRQSPRAPAAAAGRTCPTCDGRDRGFAAAAVAKSPGERRS